MTTEGSSKQTPMADRSKLLKSLVNALSYLSFAGLFGGLMYLVYASGSDTSGSKVGDLTFYIGMPVLFFICSRVLAKGKVLSLWIMSAGVLFCIGYGFAAGRGAGFGIAVLGGVFIWQMLVLKKQGELS